MELDTFFKDHPDWRPFADLLIMPPTAEELQEEFKGRVDPEVLSRCGEVIREGGSIITRGALYVRIRREERRVRDGDRWATMLCLQAPPGLQTTDTFWAGRKTWVEHYGEEYANNVKAQFAKKGIHIGPNMEYMPELVRPGFGPHNPDPEAIMPFDGARSRIKKLCEERGWACEGAVSVKHRQPESDPLDDDNCVKMAPDLIRQKGRNMLKENPDAFKGMTLKEAREKIIDKHGPSKTKGRIVDVSQIGK